METKIYAIIKVGYCSGTYGLNAEIFTAVIFNGKELSGTIFWGLYGAEYRVAKLLQAKGYTKTYLPEFYGKLRNRELKHIYSEDEAVKYIKDKY